jgi:Phage integrase, N-terminal SAM-like domain
MLVPGMSRSLFYPAAQQDACMAHLAVHETGPAALPKPRLLDRVRDEIRSRHYSRRTEKAYVAWIRRYIFFHGKRHPAEMGAPEITRFLTSLAVDRKVAASTQNQALSALLFLYRDVSGTPRPQRREHDNDLHPRPEPRPRRGPEPSGPHLQNMTCPSPAPLCGSAPMTGLTRSVEKIRPRQPQCATSTVVPPSIQPLSPPTLPPCYTAARAASQFLSCS